LLSRRASASAEVGPAVHDFQSRDGYRSAIALAILILLWGLVVVRFDPQLPLGLAAGRFSVVGLAAIGLMYFLFTWRRPNLDVATAFSIAEIGLVGVLIGWAGWTLAPLGREWQVVAVGQLALASIPLIAPRYVWVGIAFVILFSLQLVAIVVHQSQLPVEPFNSLMMAAVALAVLALREQRQRIGVEYLRTASESATLQQLRPLFCSVREQLGRALSTISEASASFGDPLIDRSSSRLSDLGQRIGELESAADGADAISSSEAERLLFARDAQIGATLFAAGALGVVLFALLAVRGLALDGVPAMLWWCGAVYAVILCWLLWTRRRPTARRGLVASVCLFVVATASAVFMHVQWSNLLQPVNLFIGEKLILAALVMIRPLRLWLGMTMVGIVGLAALIAQHFAPGLSATQQVRSLEQGHTLLFVGLGVVFMLMGEQRRIASLKLLRAQSEAGSLRRRASIFLALCDQLNSPLQTLLLRFTLRGRETGDDLNASMERLRELSAQLRRLSSEQPGELQRLSLDGAAELRSAIKRE
jgi:hypothetical protein